MVNWSAFTKTLYRLYSTRRLDNKFIYNSLQEFVNDTRILTSVSTDHSPVHLSLSKENKHTKGNEF